MMDTSAPSRPSVNQPFLGEDLHYASYAVNISNLDKHLADFLRWLAPIHRALFGKPLIVTSGKDGEHAVGSKHYIGKSVDVRTSDITDTQQVLLLHVLSLQVDVWSLAIFDERALPGAPHMHIELV